ncbi:MAG: hypothetical protein IJV81_01200 [Paludibacteraceae bacterium]|nr:hypothetical protein [Paludibacteraceae bacterium]
MTNDIQHYKRVVAATGQARWDGIISFGAFSDRERSMACNTQSDDTIYEDEVMNAKKQIKLWANNYYLNRWENQPIYPEVLIEKKALEGVFYKTCMTNGVALGACKGYPSLTFLHDISFRIKEAEYRGKQPIILYFGDYDPSGEDIPRALRENLIQLGCNEELEVRRICLNEDQVIDWGLPPAPTKDTDSRSVHWTGLGQVELDAVKPEKLMNLLQGAIDEVFDEELYDELKERERREATMYRTELKEFIENNLT